MCFPMSGCLQVPSVAGRRGQRRPTSRWPLALLLAALWGGLAACSQAAPAPAERPTASMPAGGAGSTPVIGVEPPRPVVVQPAPAPAPPPTRPPTVVVLPPLPTPAPPAPLPVLQPPLPRPAPPPRHESPGARGHRDGAGKHPGDADPHRLAHQREAQRQQALAERRLTVQGQPVATVHGPPPVQATAPAPQQGCDARCQEERAKVSKPHPGN
jgi:hypothetical protein